MASKEDAVKLIAAYGEEQRKTYQNPDVVDIEERMETAYGILAVNLGEIDVQTAEEIEQAFAYMYARYPVLQGTLTNLTLGNFPTEQASVIALTDYREFIINGEFAARPTVVRYEIVLNAAKFRNRDQLLKTCRNSVQNGYWPEGMDITALIVHELGHQLETVIMQKRAGLTDAYYITEENEDAFSSYIEDGLSRNQTTSKALIEQAEEIWKNTYGHTGTDEEFRTSISGYAEGTQQDGGIFYTEAITDIYLNGDQAADASKSLKEAIQNNLK